MLNFSQHCGNTAQSNIEQILLIIKQIKVTKIFIVEQILLIINIQNMWKAVYKIHMLILWLYDCLW